MKNIKKTATLLLTSLTLMTGCNVRGWKITRDEAIAVIEDIYNEASDKSEDDLISFTAKVDIEATQDNEEVEITTKIKYDADNRVLYYKLNLESVYITEKIEYYCGYKGESVYFFDVITENYYVYSGDDKDKIWDDVEEYLAFPIIKSEEIADELLFIAYSDDGDNEDVKTKYYTSGKGNVYVKYINKEDTEEESKIIYQFKDNLVIKEIIEGQDIKGNKINMKTNVRYRANVKLPSTKGYTKRENTNI